MKLLCFDPLGSLTTVMSKSNLPFLPTLLAGAVGSSRGGVPLQPEVAKRFSPTWIYSQLSMLLLV